MPSDQFHIGIDLGGTKVEGILLDAEFQELKRVRRPTEADQGYERILQNICQVVSDLKGLTGTQKYTIGMGIPGIQDPESGLVRNANTTILIGKPLKQDLKQKLGHEILIENDANCFTLAECKSGAAREYQVVFGIIMGTGCGGGICINGQVRRGLHGISGEWGHVSLDPNGVECYSGIQGCIESLISGSGVQAAYERRFGQKKAMADIVADYRGQDPQAQEIMEQFFLDFGRAVGGLINILDPDAIVIGGGLSNIAEIYSHGVDEILPWLFNDQLHTPILHNKLGDSAGVIGAAWVGAGIADLH